VKYTALILLFSIFALAFQPVFSALHPTGCTEHAKSCCAASHPGHHQQNKKNTNDCCSNGICNPFGACGCCLGFYVQPQSFKIAALLLDKILNPAFQQFIPTDIVADNFHPPELV
jgi:hypothetical protein